MSCGAVAAGRATAGAGPGRGPQQAVWCGAAVLRLLWPPSPCRGAAPCRLPLVAGGGGWCCCCGAATHASLSVAACNRGLPSLTSVSTSGLSRPVLPRRLWRVVCWVGFLSDVIGGVFTAGRMVLRFFLGSYGTLVAASEQFMKRSIIMPLRDSDIPMNVPFTLCNKQPLTPGRMTGPRAG